MSEPIAQQSPESLKHAGHEVTDASAFYVGLFAVALAIVILMCLVFLNQMFWRLEAAAKRTDPVASPVVSNQLPPGPRLQAQPAADLTRLRHDEDKILRGYKWIDQQQGIVQIPVDRAIDLLSEHGLSEPKAAEPPSNKQKDVR
jgi:hypothetical protein